MRPNLLLIVFDTARSDAFEGYGASVGSTPSVAQLTTRGLAHPLSYAPASWTVPSHCSMFSGLLPRSAGIQRGAKDHSSFRAGMRRLRARLLPNVLASLGYHSIGLSANGWISEASGFDTGFTSFSHHRSSRVIRLGHRGPRSRLRWANDVIRSQSDDGAAEIERHLRQMDLEDHQPFFCFVNLVECHSPYLPPKPFNRLNWRERLRAASDANRYCTLEALWKSSLGVAETPPVSLHRMRSLYLDSIRQLDAWLGRVLTMFDESGLLDDTQVVVTSDHGENFGEGGLRGHTFSLDDRLIRVPFVTAGPLALDLPPAMTLTDLPRVLADALHLEDHPWHDTRRDPGVVVTQFVAPGTPDDRRSHEVVKAWGIRPEGQRTLFRSFDCATDGQLKLFRDAQGETLVDLDVDPLELQPRCVGPDLELVHHPAIKRLQAALDEANATSIQHVPFGALDGDQIEGPSSESDVSQLEDQMRLLGYI